MEEKKYGFAFVQSKDEERKVIHLDTYTSDVYDRAREAILVLNDNPGYSVGFLSNCGNGITREYVLTQGMNIEDFDKMYKKEDAFYREQS